jgi:type II secretory pathway pseudopilin PulG
MSRHVGGSRRSAFTIIEVLVVAGIIALLASILTPALWRARRYSQSAGCLSNLRNIGIAMNAYAQCNKGWLPAGPADQFYGYMNINSNISSPEYSVEPQQGGGWRPILYTPWQWGGRRAFWQYLEDEDGKPIPETLLRPLTRQVYRTATLDSRTPVFECPGDDGLEYWDRAHRGAWAEQGLGRRPLYEMLGNSYSVQIWGGIDFGEERIRKAKRRPGQIVLLFEAVFDYDRAYYSPPIPSMPDLPPPIQQRGWHGHTRGYNMQFVDGHGEFKNLRKLVPGLVSAQQGWVIMNYTVLMDYYR